MIEPWFRFTCINCMWTVVGTYNFNRDPELEGLLPDTDCSRCGGHDTVRDGDDQLPRPSAAKIAKTRKEIAG